MNDYAGLWEVMGGDLVILSDIYFTCPYGLPRPKVKAGLCLG